MIQCNCGYDMKHIICVEEADTEIEVDIWQCKECGTIAITKSNDTNIIWEKINRVEG